MRKKLTAIGVLSALALGAGILIGGGSASATPPPIQNFNVNNSICYGSGPADGVLACPGTSATIGTSGSTADTYQVTNLTQGSRLTLPIIYTPSTFGFTPGSPGAVVGDVSSQTDLLCDGSLDVLAAGLDVAIPLPAGASDWNSWTYDLGSGLAIATSGTLGDPHDNNVDNEDGTDVYPKAGTWIPFPFVHQQSGPAVGFAGKDAYVNVIKPTPSTFTAVSHDKADLFTLWLSKATGLFLPSIQNGLPTPLNTVTETSPYTAGLRTSLTMLAGNPSPPSNSFLTCLDSPQDSVARNTQITQPVPAGLYPRWTIYTSAMDERGGNVSRIIDVSCLSIGGATDGADLDCTDAAAGPANPAGIDADGDFIVDGVEAAYGTDPNVGFSDTDGDGASDLEEMAYFTRPSTTSVGFVADCPGPSTLNNAEDTDCDGSKDRQDNGTDENGATAGLGDTTIDDNCPADADTTQANADSDFDFGNGPLSDSTNPSADVLGDACDSDDDNDRMSDAAEGGLHIAPALTASGWCKPSTAGGAVLNVTSTTNPDTDFDLGLDGAECKFDTNPQDFASRMTGASLAAGGQETFYRTQKINKPSGGQEDNPDGDTFLTGDSDTDSDNDGLQDGAEVKYYGTHPSNDDSDNDGCKDGIEAADVNGSRTVNATDLSQVSQRLQNNYLPASDPVAVPIGRTNYDYTRDRNVNATDLSQVAQRFTTVSTQCNPAVGLIVVPGPQSAAPLP